MLLLLFFANIFFDCPISSSATVNEDYIDVELNITFTSGQNASGDNNEQCFFVPILNDDLLECNETFDILITPISEDENVVNITNQVITVTIVEDPNDCKIIELPDNNYCLHVNTLMQIHYIDMLTHM